jgi:hypothetical protein
MQLRSDEKEKFECAISLDELAEVTALTSENRIKAVRALARESD